MTAITRRNALVGAGAAVAVVSIPIATAQADDADAHATVAAWHKSYRACMEVQAWDQAMRADPENDPEEIAREYYARGYGEMNGAWYDIDKKLQTLKPQTTAGATALMSCPMAVLRDRQARRRGENVPDYCYYVGTDPVLENAYAALERLAGGLLS